MAKLFTWDRFCHMHHLKLLEKCCSIYLKKLEWLTWERSLSQPIYLRSFAISCGDQVQLICLERSLGWFTWEVLLDLLENRCGSTWFAVFTWENSKKFYLWEVRGAWGISTKLLEKRCRILTGDQVQLFLLERGLVGLSWLLSWDKKMINVNRHLDKNCSQVNGHLDKNWSQEKSSLGIWVVHK